MLTAVLLARSDFAALRWMALMPLGDVYLAFSAGAGAPIVGHHLAIAVFLLVAALFLGRAAKAREMQP